MVSSSPHKQSPFSRLKAPHVAWPLHPFADIHYLQGVISHLASARKGRGIGVGELTQRAGLRKGTIRHAERNGVVPKTSEFKAWANALEFSWEEVWSATFPAGTHQIRRGDSLPT